MRTQDSRLILLVFLVALSLLSPVIPGSWGWAEEARTPKGPDVTTSGTGPYTGPTPAELAKVAFHGATPEAIPVAKTPDVITVSREEGNVLTPAELAKLQTLLEGLLVPDMVKLPAMEVPKDGTPEMTGAEREKLTQQRAPGTVGSPESESGVLTPGGGPTPAPTDQIISATPENGSRSER